MQYLNRIGKLNNKETLFELMSLATRVENEEICAKVDELDAGIQTGCEWFYENFCCGSDEV